MNKFHAIFGIAETDVRKTCILLPILMPDILKKFGIKRLSRGKIYHSGSNKNVTIIKTGIGPGISGDAVLYLGETQCQNIILFGSCGLVKEKKGLTVGSLVMPTECYSIESFSDMLLDGPSYQKSFKPDMALLEKLFSTGNAKNIKKVMCATLASLKLEEGYVDSFTENTIDVVDMECSAFFSASRAVNKKAAALFYVTDIINKVPFYNLGFGEKLSISSSIKTALEFLWKAIEKNSTS